jgi:putative restriction endonuclease
MSFCWVNHKQTFKAELGEGYIWSPFRNNNGGRNQSYDNLALTRVNDIIFSYAGGEIRAVGVVSHLAEESPRPAAFGQIGNQWSAEGWLVQVNWIPLRKRLLPRENMLVLAPLLPSKYSPIQSNGNGNQGIYLAALDELLGQELLRLIEESNIGTRLEITHFGEELMEIQELENIDNSSKPPTTRTAIIQARNGQGPFRQAVEQIESACRLTGVSEKPFLIASHIKPWRCSNDNERLDGHNGLLLSPHVDKLFDKGYISFSDRGAVLLAHQNVKAVMKNWQLRPDINVGSFTPKQKEFLDYHRDIIFSSKKDLLKAAFA